MFLPISRIPSLVCLVAAVAILPPTAPAQDANFDARARQIVSQMTLDEKVSQMHGISEQAAVSHRARACHA